MSTEIVVDASDLLRVGDRFLAGADTIKSDIAEAMLAIGERGKEIAVDGIKSVSPVKSGALRDSTEGEVEADAETVKITVRATATSAPNRDGSGGGFEYVKAVIGGREGITAPSDGPFSTGKKALAGPGFGPVKSVGPAAPHNYPEEVKGDIDASISAMLAHEGNAILDALEAFL